MHAARPSTHLGVRLGRTAQRVVPLAMLAAAAVLVGGLAVPGLASAGDGESLSLLAGEERPDRLTAAELRANRAGSPVARPTPPNLAADGTAVAVVLWDELGPVQDGRSGRPRKRAGHSASLTIRTSR